MANHTTKSNGKHILMTAIALGKDAGSCGTTAGTGKLEGRRLIAVAGFQRQYESDHNSELYNAKGDEVVDTAQGLNRAITTAISEVEKLMRHHMMDAKSSESKVAQLKAGVVKVEGNIDIGDEKLSTDKTAFQQFLTGLL
tara:strand:+ start:135 stop:554 length:420 start_codon:yes stop_codon:yes gene_type:complete